ncbi:MAG: DNA-binding transcriptional ArsR family regulator [Alphaproteobacteria bacterium]|jgi:DNA-binding transcriptional ArsR family regulator
MNNFIEQNRDLHKRSDDIADKLQTLANGNRLRILCHLAAGPLSVGEIEECVQMSQSAVSQHLAKLKRAQIVTNKKDAQTSYYYIEDERTLNLMVQMYEAFCEE